ncbi:MAG: hypothetical protein H7251_19505 [Acetobacteraceae bacterium]|nr:hypothetical protein [Acetobacteraceae bacterium]
MSVLLIARMQGGAGKTVEALGYLRRGRQIMARLVALDPNHAGWWRDLECSMR